MKFIKIIILLLIPIIMQSFPGKGKGTIDDPYQITNVNELQSVIIITDSGIYAEDGNYILMNDIDASETHKWNIGDHDGNPSTPDEPMGFYPIWINAYRIFNGNGYIIYKLYINRPTRSSVGLFNFTNFSILENLGIVDCDITGRDFVGGMMGQLTNSDVSECFVMGKVSAIDGYAGGFCFLRSESATIRNCYSNCILNSKHDTYCFGVTYSYGSFINCYTVGMVINEQKFSIFGPGRSCCSLFWDTEVTGIPDTIPNDQAFGLPTAEMMKRSTFENAGWDFDSVWCIDEGKSYPKLRVFGNCTETDVPEPSVNRNGISIYPNPATSQIVISGLWLGAGMIEIYNLLGKAVKKIPISPHFSIGELEVDVSSLTPGIYYISLMAACETVIKQFAVIR